MSDRPTTSALVLATLVALVALVACTPRRQDAGAAVVRDEAGVPCFAIASTDATRSGAARLERVQVVDEQGRDLWLARFADAAPLLPARCVPYGDAGAAAEVTAQLLRPGQVYRVAVTAPMAAHPNETVHYSADFCVLDDERAKARKVHQLEWDATAARWRREACTGATP